MVRAAPRATATSGTMRESCRSPTTLSVKSAFAVPFVRTASSCRGHGQAGAPSQRNRHALNGLPSCVSKHSAHGCRIRSRHEPKFVAGRALRVIYPPSRHQHDQVEGRSRVFARCLPQQEPWVRRWPALVPAPDRSRSCYTAGVVNHRRAGDDVRPALAHRAPNPQSSQSSIAFSRSAAPRRNFTVSSK